MTDRSDADRALLAAAREAIAAHVESRPRHRQSHPALGGPSQPLFVTLRTSAGALRGCIGHLSAAHATLGDELADVAVASAVQDRRFSPVQSTELDGLSLEISLLEPEEPVADVRDLDPQRYGLVVTRGSRRGVLLPAIPTVDTVAQQLAITKRKAGLPADAQVKMSRFEVRKIAE